MSSVSVCSVSCSLCSIPTRLWHVHNLWVPFTFSINMYLLMLITTTYWLFTLMKKRIRVHLCVYISHRIITREKAAYTRCESIGFPAANKTHWQQRSNHSCDFSIQCMQMNSHWAVTSFHISLCRSSRDQWTRVHMRCLKSKQRWVISIDKNHLHPLPAGQLSMITFCFIHRNNLARKTNPRWGDRLLKRDLFSYIYTQMWEMVKIKGNRWAAATLSDRSQCWISENS